MASLDCFLSQAECQAISQSIREKIEQHLRKQEENLSVLKIQHVKSQTQSEQKCFELDVQLQQIQEQSSLREATIQTIEEEKRKLESELNSSRDQQRDMEAKLAIMEKNVMEFKKEKDLLQSDKEELSLLLSRRNDDLDRLTTELRHLTDQIVSANKEKSEALIKAEELSSKQLALDYKEKRLNQERELLVRQQQFLQEELDKRTKEVLNMRREKTNQILELQAELSEKIEEIRIAQSTIANLTETNENQQIHIKELTEEMKIRAENELKICENNRQELRSQVRLGELYKASSEDAQAKADELTAVIEELQRLLREASTRYSDLETNSKTEIDQLKEKINQDKVLIEELQKELENANTLLDSNKTRLMTEESMETMSPSAAAASKLLKSGMTLTQIFSQYVTLSQQLVLKEEENKRLNGYIDQILQEIESKAPALARQREDYEKSVEMVANLTNQLELASEEVERERHSASEARRKLMQIERSHQRYEKQAKDLGAQVSFLLREIEILKGNRIPDRPENEMEVSSSDGSAAEVISRHLVTFRDIEEIQKKNQELLQVVRELSENQDEAEKNAVDARTAKIQQALENALAEIENLREARKRHEELMESVVQQRDMYRKLVQEAGLNSSHSPIKLKADFLTSTPAAHFKAEGLRSNLELEKLLSETNGLLQKNEEKCAALVKEKNDMEKALREKVDHLTEQLTETRSQNTRVATQIQYMEEKEKLLMGNLDSYKKQVEALEQKNATMSCTVAKHEHSIAIFKDEIMSAQQQLAKAEVTIAMLREEKQLLKDAEQRLLLEKESLLGERRSQSLLHANLEAIKLNLERSESETKMRLQNSVTSLEQQCELMRKKLDMEEERFRETVKSFESKIQMEQATAKTAEERAVKAEAMASKLQELLTSAERSSITSPNRKGQVSRLLSSGVSSENDQVNELRLHLSETRSEAENLREQLELVRQEAQQYRAIADSMEEELRKSNEAGRTFRQEMEQHAAQLTSERDTLFQNVQKLEERLKEAEEQVSVLTKEKADRSEEIMAKMSCLESELLGATEKLKLAEEVEVKIRQECLEYVRSSQEAQEKYERELLQHAATVEQLNCAREKVEEQRTEKAVLEQSVARLEEELNNVKTSWDVQKSKLETELSESKSWSAELEKQVDLLQQQIVTLSSRMAAATRVQEMAIKPQEDVTQPADGSNDEETRSVEHLLELISFLRREKEIALSRFEVTEAETWRLKTELEQVQRQLTEAQAVLQQERQRSATSALTSSKHTELLRKLETLNALTDSNRLLREELTNATQEKEKLETRVAALEGELQPLRDASQSFNNRIEELTNENQALKRQVVTWKARTNALQERAGRVTADDIKRLQVEKEQLQKQLEQAKENQARTTSVLTEFQRTNGQLLAAQQKHLEENRKLKEENQQLTQKNAALQNDLTASEIKRKEEETKAADKIDPLRRIARKYKAQYEELKIEHDKLVAEHSAASAAGSVASTSSASVALKTEESASGETSSEAANQAKVRELEERNAQLVAEMEQLKKDHENTTQSVDEKTKSVLKQTRLRLTNLQKERESLANELTEARAKISSLEMSIEECNARATSLRTQFEARLLRLERENSELLQAKQAADAEVESLNQRIPVIQRQMEAYQKQLALCQQQQQATQTVKSAAGAEKTTTESNPPTANIKPMASTSVPVQRPPITGSPSPGVPGASLVRTTPTASIRPMAMPPRTAAVQPTSVAVSPMTPPVAVTTPTPIIPIAISVPATQVITTQPQQIVPVPAVVVREEEEPLPSTSNAADNEGVRKRTRPTETEQAAEEQEQKRTRVEAEEMEEVEALDEEDGEVVEEDEEEARATETQIDVQGGNMADDEEMGRAEDGEHVADEESEGLIESEGEERIGEENEEEEEINDVEEQRDEPIIQLETQTSEEIGSNVVSADLDTGDDVPADQLGEGTVETETLSATEAEPASANPASVDLAVPGPSGFHPPPQEDRLPAIGRNTIPYEDGGDDGIVPSTPVLLKPRSNDGFAEAVSSPQVTSRFVFSSVPDDASTASIAGSTAQHDVLSHLSESQGMDDTRMDLTQLDENVGLSVPSTPLRASPTLDVPAASATAEESTAEVASAAAVLVLGAPAEEANDLESAADLETDAAAELDLLGEDDSESKEQPDSTAEAALEQESAEDREPMEEGNPNLEESAPPPAPVTGPEATGPSEQVTGTSSTPTVSVSSSRPNIRRDNLMSRGRGSLSRDDPGRAGIARLVPITWTPEPNPPVFHSSMTSRGAFRRAPLGTPVMPMAGSPALIQEPGATVSARARRARGRPRAGRRM